MLGSLPSLLSSIVLSFNSSIFSFLPSLFNFFCSVFLWTISCSHQHFSDHTVSFLNLPSFFHWSIFFPLNSFSELTVLICVICFLPVPFPPDPAHVPLCQSPGPGHQRGSAAVWEGAFLRHRRLHHDRLQGDQGHRHPATQVSHHPFSDLWPRLYFLTEWRSNAF